MSESRQDGTSGAWVVIAPEHGRRRRQWHDRENMDAAVPSFDPDCPFCPGHERLLAPIIDEVLRDDPPRWRIRRARSS